MTLTEPVPVTTPPSRRRRWPRVLGVVAAVVVLGAGAVVVDALSVPGDDSVAAKLAAWGRDHGLNPVITWLEERAYENDQPPTGGVPEGGIPQAAGAIGPPVTAAPLHPLSGTPALPGEGRWQTVVQDRGRPAVQVALLRPDPQHTSFVVGVLRMDPQLVTGELHPGAQDPGGTWRAPSGLTAAEQRRVAVVFNGGFRLTDPSHNGYYSEGRTIKPLRAGAASLVLHTDGTADVGAWGTEVHLDATVASVRQNLVPLVDGGAVNPTCATGGEHEWGSTIGNAAFIHRSGFGVTATGEEVYVGGPALSVCTLGRILADAGVVRGMELDINPAWVSGAYFHDTPSGAPIGFKLFPAEQVAPTHYLATASRDWFSWLLR